MFYGSWKRLSLLWEYCPGPASLGLALKRCLHVTVWKVISNCPGASSEGKWVVVLWPQFNHKYFLRPGPRWSWAFYSLVAFCYQTLKTALDSLDTVDTLVDLPLVRDMLSRDKLYFRSSAFYGKEKKPKKPITDTNIFPDLGLFSLLLLVPHPGLSVHMNIHVGCSWSFWILPCYSTHQTPGSKPSHNNISMLLITKLLRLLGYCHTPIGRHTVTCAQ